MISRSYIHRESGIQFSVPADWVESYGQVGAAAPIEVQFRPPALGTMMQFSVRRVTEVEEATFDQLISHVSSNAVTHGYRMLRTTRLTLASSNISVILAEFISGFWFWKRRNWLITFVAEGIQPVLRMHSPLGQFCLDLPAFVNAAQSFEFRGHQGFELDEACSWFAHATGLQRIGDGVVGNN